ncbi:MAG: histidine phosphatase family protein, partial [Candidatus Omnitrophica bacterium]|nr:histidine phosphatase family protein [Candidatus Omnitrophota bacterium]
DNLKNVTTFKRMFPGGINRNDMKHLYLMRHAKSSWDDPFIKDHERPLNERGIRAAQFMGAWVSQHLNMPEVIISSSATRAQQTAEIFIQASSFRGKYQQSEILYGSGPRDYAEVLSKNLASTNLVMLIAHNPTIEEFVEKSTGKKYDFPTAALAHLKLDINFWQDIVEAKKVNVGGFWKPKDLMTND